MYSHKLIGLSPDVLARLGSHSGHCNAGVRVQIRSNRIRELQSLQSLLSTENFHSTCQSQLHFTKTCSIRYSPPKFILGSLGGLTAWPWYSCGAQSQHQAAVHWAMAVAVKVRPLEPVARAFQAFGCFALSARQHPHSHTTHPR